MIEYLNNHLFEGKYEDMSNGGMTSTKRNIIVAIMLVSAFAAMLNQTILNTALPAITQSMHISETTAQWLVTGFMLVNGIMIPMTAYLMDKFSTKWLYIISMATFVVVSFLSAFATGFELLMFARVIQAIGAGVMLPLMQFTVFTLFPVERRGFAMGLTGIVAQSAPAVGPTLTGLLIDQFSWRSPFIVVATVAVLAFIVGAIFVEDTGKKRAAVLDKISVVYSTFGFGLILYAFSSVSKFGFASPVFWVSLIVGVVILAVFTLRQLRINHPLLNVRVFKNTTFTLSALASMVIFIGIVGPALLIPMYVQNGLGLTALLSGLVILPGAVVNALISVYTGKVYDRFGARVLLIPGFVLFAIMTFLHIFLSADTPYWYVVVIYAVRMFSVGLVMMPLNAVGLNALESKDISHGTAIMNSVRIIAGAIGIAVSITIMSLASRHFMATYSGSATHDHALRLASIHGIDAAFIFTTILIVIGCVLVCFIKEERRSRHTR